MLEWFTGESVRRIPLSRTAFYESGIKKIENNELQEMYDYVNGIIDELPIQEDGKKKFVPAWNIPTIWTDIPLKSIGKMWGYDTEESARWFGLLVMDVIINRKGKWYAGKFNFDRPHDQTVYWTNEESITE